MPRRIVSEDVEKVVERHRAKLQLFNGGNVGFDEALEDILLGKAVDLDEELEL